MAIVGPYEDRVNRDVGVNKYIGLSTDTKPTRSIRPGDEFYETDTGLTYVYTGSAWAKR